MCMGQKIIRYSKGSHLTDLPRGKVSHKASLKIALLQTWFLVWILSHTTVSWCYKVEVGMTLITGIFSYIIQLLIPLNTR